MIKKGLKVGCDSIRSEPDTVRAEVYKMIGRIQMGNYFAKIGTGSNLIFLKQVKESKIYKEIPEIGTWENFCKLTGYSTRWIDEQLKNLEIFGAEFLELSSKIGVSPSDYRRLRQLPDAEIKRLTDGSEIDLTDSEAVKDLIEDLITDKSTAQKNLAAGIDDSIKKLGKLADENQNLKDQNHRLLTLIDTPQKYLDAFNRADDHIMAVMKIINSLPDKLIKDDLTTQSKITGALVQTQTMIDNITFRIAELTRVSPEPSDPA